MIRLPGQTHQKSIARPLPVRCRRELSASAQWHRGRKFWVVKDPVSLKYFHLRDEEYAILLMLDGETSLESIQNRFERQFSPQKIRTEGILAFVASLHRNGLVVTDAAGQGDELIARFRRGRRERAFAAIANILAIRFRGIDPEPFLRWASPAVRWLFRPMSVLAGLSFAVAALVLVVVQYDTVLARLPTIDAFLKAETILLLLISLSFVKVLHEFSHAFACRNFGGECHEIGLMFLVFTPCLYCNVTDSWMFSNKWRRIAVAAAGMYTELLLASVCAFLWWFTVPGLFNTLCLNTVIICSISTVLVNGNPLLRYDGYFIFADLIEVPNLWEKSRAALRGILSRGFLGIETPTDHRAPANQRGTLVAYAAASMTYRVVIVALILWFVHRILMLHRLEIVGQLLIGIVIAGTIAVPVKNGVRFFRDPIRRSSVRPTRLIAVATVLLGLIAVILFVPLPYSVTGPVIVEADSAQTVYVTEPGRLTFAIQPGAAVDRHDVLAKLDDPKITEELLVLEGERKRQIQRLKNLQSLRLHDPSVAAEIPVVRERIADLEQQFRQRRHDAEGLVLKAPMKGVVFAPIRRPTRASDSDQLDPWSGTPLDPQNIGSHLESQTAVCVVGRPDRFQAVALIEENDVEFVRTGQDVQVILDQSSGIVLKGTVVELARIDLENLPDRLTGDTIPVATDSDGRSRLLKVFYRVRIELESSDRQLLHGARGRVRISVPRQTLGRRLSRMFRGLFTFELKRGS